MTRAAAAFPGLAAALIVALAAASCDRSVFEPVTQPVSYVSAAAGGAHSCGVALGGSLYCWGRGGQGQLGDGLLRSSDSPVRVGPANAAFSSVTLGQHHSCAVGDDGRAHCWGWNHRGQLGVGNDFDGTEPQPVGSGLTFVHLSAGFQHTCGVTAAGDAWCWGDNAQGQLGDGTTTRRYEPVRVGGDHTFSQISAGGYHTCALDARGQPYCWGLNYLGQLGVGDTEGRTLPTPVAGNGPYTQVTAGGMHSCAIDGTGRARCWGSARHGELGNGQVSPEHAAEATVTTPRDVHRHRHDGEIVFRFIDAGLHFTCGADSRGRAWCWGLGHDGQLGGNEMGVYSTPRPVFATLDLRFTAVSAGHGTHACGITDTHNAFCWGFSPDGGLGPGPTFSAQPVRIPGPHR